MKIIKMTTDNHDTAGNEATLMVSYEVAKLFIELNLINDKMCEYLNIQSTSVIPELKPLLDKQSVIFEQIRSLDTTLSKWDLRTRWVVDVTQYERELKLIDLTQ